jgi:hypothetical protein
LLSEKQKHMKKKRVKKYRKKKKDAERSVVSYIISLN